MKTILPLSLPQDAETWKHYESLGTKISEPKRKENNVWHKHGETGRERERESIMD